MFERGHLPLSAPTWRDGVEAALRKRAADCRKQFDEDDIHPVRRYFLRGKHDGFAEAADIIRALSPAPTPADGWRSAAATDVLAERRRQVEAEGWTVEHDDKHDDGVMAAAAACYAICDNEQAMECVEFFDCLWPWSNNWWKPANPRRNLVKAGALILAEIERLDRKQRPLPAPPLAQPETETLATPATETER